MKRIIFVLLVLFAASSLVEAAGRYSRIVSLAPSITEILFALGLDEQIVGVTNFCDHPEGALKKPKIGGMSNPSIEAVVRLRPDLVILTTDGNPKYMEERLKSLHIKTYVFRARRISELPEGIRNLGKFIGIEETADGLASRIETGIRSFSSPRGRVGKKRGVLFVIWPDPLIVAGPGTAIDDALNILGLKNLAGDSLTNYPRYSLEELIRKDPDIIFIGKGHEDMKEMAENLKRRIGPVRAVREGRVYIVSDALYRLGPRVLEGIKELAGYLE